MLQKTHSVAGFIAAEVVIHHLGLSFLSWEAAGALLLGCLSAALPDVDKQGSTMAKLLFPLSALLRILNVRHRTLTHSVLMIIALALLVSPLPLLYFQTFMFAFASHPFIDLLNEKGVQLFWPLKLNIRLLPKWLAIDTGSLGETVFRWLLLAAALWIPYYMMTSK